MSGRHTLTQSLSGLFANATFPFAFVRITFIKWVSVAAVRKHRHRELATIAVAHRSGSPSYVHGPAVCDAFVALAARIVTVIIDAVEIVFASRLPAYIAKEHLEGFTPSSANSDASPAVSGVGRRANIKTTYLHPSPRLIRGRIGHAVAQVAFRCPLAPEATATLRVSAFQQGTAHNTRCSAITQTVPVTVRAAWSQVGSPDNYQAVEPLTNKMKGSGHRNILRCSDRGLGGCTPGPHSWYFR